MIENNDLCETPDAIFQDLSFCDIDIDFEFNEGQGAWVVVLSRKPHSPQLLPNTNENS